MRKIKSGMYRILEKKIKKTVKIMVVEWSNGRGLIGGSLLSLGVLYSLQTDCFIGDKVINSS